MPSAICFAIGKKLKSKAEKKFQEGVYHYFKEQINPLGVRLPEVKKLAKETSKQLKNKFSFQQFMALSEEFQSSGWFEEQIFGVYLIELQKKEFTEKTFFIFEKWIDKYVGNWAYCDLFCSHSVAYCIDENPRLLRQLLKWTSSKNRWMRRAAAVTLIAPARRGKYLKEILKIAERNMYDADDLVQKGTGWLLREAAKSHQKQVFDFLLKHKSAGRVLLRYAVEKFPTSLRKKVLN